MLNLIKYDFRKVSTLLYALFAVTLIAHSIIVLMDRNYGWWDEISLMLGLTVMSTLLQVFYIVVIYQFNATLKSVTRRLLPVSTVKEYWSHLVVPLVISLLFLLEFILFVAVIKPVFKIEEINALFQEISMTEMVVGVIIFTLFYSLFTFMFYFFAVIITRLFRTNAKIVIFIGILIVGSVAYTLLIELILVNPDIMHLANIRTEIYGDGHFYVSFMTFNWTMLIDVALMAIMSYISIHIMKHKLEV